MISKKSPNLVGYYGEKPGKIEKERDLGLLCLLNGSDCSLNKLTLFLLY